MEVESSVKNESATSDSKKIKENEDMENKNVEETADDDKSGMYLKYSFHIEIFRSHMLQAIFLQRKNQKNQESVNVPTAIVAAVVAVAVVLLVVTANWIHRKKQKLVSEIYK